MPHPRRAASSSRALSSFRPRPRPRYPSARAIVWMSASSAPRATRRPAYPITRPASSTTTYQPCGEVELFAHHGVRPGVGGNDERSSAMIASRSARAGSRPLRCSYAVTRFGAVRQRDVGRAQVERLGRRGHAAGCRWLGSPRSPPSPPTPPLRRAAARPVRPAWHRVRPRDERGFGQPHRQSVVVDAVVHRERVLAATGIGTTANRVTSLPISAAARNDLECDRVVAGDRHDRDASAQRERPRRGDADA